MIIYGRIKNGLVEVQRFFRDEFYKNEGKKIEIKIVEDSKTLQQLRYLWGVVFKIVGDELGYTPEEVSYTYKEKFLRYAKEKDGKKSWFTKGISDLDKVEMSEFMDKVITHARTDLGYIIPDPDEEFEYG